MKMKRLKFRSLKSKKWLTINLAIALTLTKFNAMAQGLMYEIKEKGPVKV